MQKGPEFSTCYGTKRFKMTTKIVKCNDNFGPFLSKDGKNVDLFNREMVKDLDLFYRGFLRKGGAVAPFAPP